MAASGKGDAGRATSCSAPELAAFFAVRDLSCRAAGMAAYFRSRGDATFTAQGLAALRPDGLREGS